MPCYGRLTADGGSVAVWRRRAVKSGGDGDGDGDGGKLKIKSKSNQNQIEIELQRSAQHSSAMRERESSATAQSSGAARREERESTAPQRKAAAHRTAPHCTAQHSAAQRHSAFLQVKTTAMQKDSKQRQQAAAASSNKQQEEAMAGYHLLKDAHGEVVKATQQAAEDAVRSVDVDALMAYVAAAKAQAVGAAAAAMAVSSASSNASSTSNDNNNSNNSNNNTSSTSVIAFDADAWMRDNGHVLAALVERVCSDAAIGDYRRRLRLCRAKLRHAHIRDGQLRKQLTQMRDSLEHARQSKALAMHFSRVGRDHAAVSDAETTRLRAALSDVLFGKQWRREGEGDGATEQQPASVDEIVKELLNIQHQRDRAAARNETTGDDAGRRIDMLLLKQMVQADINTDPDWPAEEKLRFPRSVPDSESDNEGDGMTPDADYTELKAPRAQLTVAATRRSVEEGGGVKKPRRKRVKHTPHRSHRDAAHDSGVNFAGTLVRADDLVRGPGADAYTVEADAAAVEAAVDAIVEAEH
jgi:hypothetical protein